MEKYNEEWWRGDDCAGLKRILTNQMVTIARVGNDEEFEQALKIIESSIDKLYELIERSYYNEDK
jgi:hypothetical protein